MSQWYDALEAKQLTAGTMKGVEVGGTRVVLVHGTSGIRAFEDRCGHMSAPISIGAFKSGVIKCALHSAVFDAETGTVRGQPQMHSGGMGELPPEMAQAFAEMGKIMAQIRCENLHPFPVAIENGRISVFI